MMVASKHEDCFWFAPPFGTSFRWFQIVPLLSGTGTPSCLVPHPGRAASVFQTLIVKVSSCQAKAVTLRVSLELAPNLQITETF